MAPDRSLGTSSLLTAGNVTSIAIQLYRHHFRDYFKISIAANSWMLLAIAIVVFSTIAGQMINPGATVLLVVICIAVLIYGLARYLSTAAVISRHGFQVISGEPEPLPDAQRWLQQRMWGFLGIAILLFLIFSAVAIAAYLMLAIAAVIIAAPFMGIGTLGANPQQLMVIGLLFITVLTLVLGGMGYLFVWLSARFVVADMEYTLEADSGPRRSIDRGWRLSRLNGRRLMLIIMMMILATLPIQVLSQLISSLFSVGLGLIVPPEDFIYTPLLFLISYMVGLLFGAVILPLWQLAKSVVYYDLCNRREGMLLQLGDRSSTSAQDWLNHTTLVTPESVELDFMLAGIGSRSWALSLDYGILGIGLAAFWLVWAWFSEAILVWLDGSGINYSAVPYWMLAIALLITFFLFTGYFIVFETVWQGQTPGKRIMKLRVIRDNGQPVGLSQSALRSILRPIDDLLLIGAFFVVLGKREKRIGDWVAGTLVVQESTAEKPELFTVSKESKTLASLLSKDIAIDRLSPDDFATIRDYLSRRPMLDPRAHKPLRRRLAKTAKELVQLETVPEGVTAEQFLEALYVAYQKS